jgi:hypothetical protein
MTLSPGITVAQRGSRKFVRTLPDYFEHFGETRILTRVNVTRVAPGWRRSSMTVEKLGCEMVGLCGGAARFVPPAALFDKRASTRFGTAET